MDNSLSEFTFFTAFFNARGENAQRIFNAIFDSTLQIADVCFYIKQTTKIIKMNKYTKGINK